MLVDVMMVGDELFFFLSRFCSFKCSCLINQSPLKCFLFLYLLFFCFCCCFVWVVSTFSVKVFGSCAKKSFYSFRLSLLLSVWFVTSMNRSRTHNVNKTVVCLQLMKDTSRNLLVIGRTTRLFVLSLL